MHGIIAAALTLNGFIDANGATPLAISNRVMPKDQISAGGPYPGCSCTRRARVEHMKHMKHLEHMMLHALCACPLPYLLHVFCPALCAPSQRPTWANTSGAIQQGVPVEHKMWQSLCLVEQRDLDALHTCQMTRTLHCKQPLTAPMPCADAPTPLSKAILTLPCIPWILGPNIFRCR